MSNPLQDAGEAVRRYHEILVPVLHAPAALAAIVENVVRDMEAFGAAPMPIEVHVAAGAAP